MKIRLLLILALFSTGMVRAQFIQGIGAMAGVNFSNQRWRYDSIDGSFSQKFLIGMNGSFFVEYFDQEFFRVVSELQYSQEGSKLKSTNTKLRLSYVSFNNYLKLRQELYDVTPYFLIGPKIKYLIGSSYNAPFELMHYSIYAGPGMEFLYRKPWIFLVELGYDIDINNALKTDILRVSNRTWMIRAGIKYQPKRKVKSCRTGGFRPDIIKKND